MYSISFTIDKKCKFYDYRSITIDDEVERLKNVFLFSCFKKIKRFINKLCNNIYENFEACDNDLNCVFCKDERSYRFSL